MTTLSLEAQFYGALPGLITILGCVIFILIVLFFLVKYRKMVK